MTHTVADFDWPNGTGRSLVGVSFAAVVYFLSFFHHLLLGFTGFHRVPLGFYWVRLGLVRVFWVLLGFY